MQKRSIILAAFLLMGSTVPLCAQRLSPGVRLGLQFVTTNMEDLGYGAWGVAGLATIDLAPPLAIGIEVEQYIESPGGHGGDLVMLAGMQLKHLMGRDALFLELLPGAVWFRGSDFTIRNPTISRRPALDVGLGFERATGDRLALRFDLTDTMLFFGRKLVSTAAQMPFRPGVVHCPGLGAGVTVRL